MARRVNALIKDGLKSDVLIAAKNTCQCTHREHAKDGFRCKTGVTLSSNFIAAEGASWYSDENVIVICDTCFSGGHATTLGLPSQFTIPPR